MTHFGDTLSETIRRTAEAMDERRDDYEAKRKAERETRWQLDADDQLRQLPQDALTKAQALGAGKGMRSAIWRRLLDMDLPGARGVLLVGPSGCGKTVAMVGAAARALLQRPPPTIAYISVASLVGGQPIADAAWWARLCLIDDFHLCGQWLPYQRQPLHALLDARREKGLTTLAASEWTRRKLVNKLGKALTDRAGTQSRTVDVMADREDWRDE